MPARAASCNGRVHLFVSLFVCLFALKCKKTQFSQKLSYLQELAHGLLIEPITGPLKSKMAEIGHFGFLRQNAKRGYFQKLSNLELWCLLSTYTKLRIWAFQRTHYSIPKIQDGWDPPSWKSTWRHYRRCDAISCIRRCDAWRCDAMRCISAVFAVTQCLPVRPSACPSVTFVDHVKTNKHIFEIFSPSGSDTIVVFPYQRGCQHSDANPPNGGNECKGVW